MAGDPADRGRGAWHIPRAPCPTGWRNTPRGRAHCGGKPLCCTCERCPPAPYKRLQARLCSEPPSEFGIMVKSVECLKKCGSCGINHSFAIDTRLQKRVWRNDQIMVETSTNLTPACRMFRGFTHRPSRQRPNEGGTMTNY